MKFTVRDLTRMALSVALMAVCSWISIPTTVPFTLQTFAVFLTLGLLGGRNGTLAVLAYILLGAVGVPVFSGFSGGIGALLGTTGGYIVGFLVSALLIWAITHHFGKGPLTLVISMVLGMIVLYAFGTAWFMLVYTNANGAVALGTVLGWCVFPFLLPDAIKLALAVLLTVRLRNRI